MSSLKCVARGASDFSAASATLDDSLVQFALIKFPVGSGTFKRNKFIYIHFIGEKCGAVKRGKWNAEAGSVLKRFDPTAAGLEITAASDLSFENVVSKMQKVFVADDGTFSLEKLRDEYNKRLEEEKKLMVLEAEAPEQQQGKEGEGEADAAPPQSPIRARKLATDLGLQETDVLKSIHQEDLGALNWCSFKPMTNNSNPQFVQGGSGGLFEMLEQLPADQCLFGVVRLSFGTGRFRRTKRIFFQWCGDEIGPVQRAKYNTLHDAMLKHLGPCQADIRLTGKEDLAVDVVLEKVSRIFVVDNIKLPATESTRVASPLTKTTDDDEHEKKKKEAGGVSLESYVEALQEEQKHNSPFFEEPEEEEETQRQQPQSPQSPKSSPTFDVDETVKLIHKDAGGLVWGVFQFA